MNEPYIYMQVSLYKSRTNENSTEIKTTQVKYKSTLNTLNHENDKKI